MAAPLAAVKVLLWPWYAGVNIAVDRKARTRTRHQRVVIVGCGHSAQIHVVAQHLAAIGHHETLPELFPPKLMSEGSPESSQSEPLSETTTELLSAPSQTAKRGKIGDQPAAFIDGDFVIAAMRPMVKLPELLQTEPMPVTSAVFPLPLSCYPVHYRSRIPGRRY